MLSILLNGLMVWFLYMQLLFSLSASNGKLERVFSTAKVIKSDK